MQELFQAIQESKEYQSYLNIGRVIEQDDEIVSLVNEIKKLQQKSVELEYHHDEGYKEIDKEIENKKIELITSMQEAFEKAAKGIDEKLSDAGTIIKENIAELRNM